MNCVLAAAARLNPAKKRIPVVGVTRSAMTARISPRPDDVSRPVRGRCRWLMTSHEVMAVTLASAKVFHMRRRPGKSDGRRRT